MELSEYSQYHEKKAHTQPGFAYNTYLCTIPLDFSKVSLHWHDEMELIYIKKGAGTVTVNFMTMPVEAGCIIPVLPGELHAIEGNVGSSMEYENIIFSLEMLTSTLADDWCTLQIIRPMHDAALSFPRPIVPRTALHAEASAALDLADRLCRDRAEGYAMPVKAALLQFLYALWKNRDTETNEASASPGRSRRLKEILTWVREHYSESVTVESAAAALGYSASHFMRIFRAETGQTFIQYLNEYRMSAASYLLLETDESITRVAQSCGFESLSYFIRSFERVYKVSPGTYRKRGGVQVKVPSG